LADGGLNVETRAEERRKKNRPSLNDRQPLSMSKTYERAWREAIWGKHNLAGVASTARKVQRKWDFLSYVIAMHANTHPLLTCRPFPRAYLIVEHILNQIYWDS